MNFENVNVTNFKEAFRGMRNPLNSWDKSDSSYCFGSELSEDVDNTIYAWLENKGIKEEDQEKFENSFDLFFDWLEDKGCLKVSPSGYEYEYFFIGPNDLKLAQRLISAGSEHSKFLRQIFVSVDISAPLYFWKELDTYKIGTTANSTSTMHTLGSTPITKECFEMGDFTDVVIEDNPDPTFIVTSGYAFNTFIEWLEGLRQKYNQTKDKCYWKELVRLLPESWLQTRTWTANYQVLRNIYSQRKNHKLTEWTKFCNWIETLPYADELITFKLD